MFMMKCTVILKVSMVSKMAFDTYLFNMLHLTTFFVLPLLDPWSYLIAMKNRRNRSLWYQSMAELDIAIHERVKRTHSGTPALKYFDAPTMKGYQIPHKGFESVFCKSSDGSESCESTEDYKRESVPSSAFEVRMSSVGDGSGRGVFAKTDIKKGTVIGPEVVHQSLYFSPAATASILGLLNSEIDPEEIYDVWKYMEGYGWETSNSVS